MYIHLDELAKRLQARVSVRSYNLGSRVVEGIEMFPVQYDQNSGSALNPNVLYVCDYRKLRFYDPHINMLPLICVLEPGAAVDEIFFFNRTMLVVSGIAVTELMAELVELAYFIGSKSSPLAESSRQLLSCRDMQELLSMGVKLLGNPIIVTDETQCVIAWEDNGSTAAPYSSIVAMEYLPVGHPALDGGDMVPDRDYPFISEGQGESETSLPTVMVKRMRSGSRIVGYLHVFQYDRDFSPEDAEVTELLGNLLAMEIRRQPDLQKKNDHQWEIDHFFQDILEK